MTFPVHVKDKKGRAEVIIYGKTEAYGFYRMAYRAGGRRFLVSFSTYAEAHRAAKDKLKQLVKGTEAGLTPMQGRDALAAVERLADLHRRTGEQFSLLAAVSEFTETKTKPGKRFLLAAVDGCLSSVVTVKRKDIAEAAREFIALRAPKAEAKDGKRAQRHPVYHRTVERVVNHFAAMFPGHAEMDLQWLSLVREHLVKNLSMDEDDFDLTPLLEMRGGKAKARKVFADLPRMVSEINEAMAF